MAIVVYSNLFLSELVIASGVRGKQMRRNSRVMVDSGEQSINVVWTQTLRQFEIGFIPMTRAAWQAIETLYEITEGGAYGFLMADPKDHRVDLGVMYAITSTTFQLYKRYLDVPSGRYVDRKVTRPDASSFAPTLSGIAMSGGSYSLNADTGVVTIPSAPTASLLGWSGLTYVPVHFMDDSIDWQMVKPGSNPDSRYIGGPSLTLEEIKE